MTTSPSAPPVLAEEPATMPNPNDSLADRLLFATGALHEAVGGDETADTTAEWFNVGFCATAASIMREAHAELLSLTAERDALLAQARQGREDAERLREAVPDWWCQCGGRAYRATALGWQCTFCRAIQPKPPLAATPSPSPEGASR